MHQESIGRSIEGANSSLTRENEHVRCPDYGIYAWPYFLSVITMGVIGLILFFSSSLLGNWALYSGLVLTIIGFYFTSTHYLYMIFHLRRIRDMGKMINEFSHSEKMNLILDLGSGTGRTTILAAKIFRTSRVIGIDIYSTRTLSKNSPKQAYENAQIEAVNNRVSFNYGDARYIPFRDQCFDMVICTSVLHIISTKDREQVIEEAKRVLKNHGKFIMIEFLRTVKTLLIYWFPAFWVFQRGKYWFTLLNSSGLQNVRMTRIGDLAVFHSEKRN